MRTEIKSLLKKRATLEILNVKDLEILHCYTQKYLQEFDLTTDEQFALDEFDVAVECELISRDEGGQPNCEGDVCNFGNLERMFDVCNGLQQV